ncbi:MAG TPA: serine/threonine-protein kinase, partial [Kofleriaceae bacterium]
KEHGVMTSVQAARATLDAARGLEAAAKAGLIHRDVKPSNLVRLSDGKVKVTDFGLAKPVDSGSEPALTAMGVVVGTPDYIAPEQARGEAIDERVDIYALGGTLYFLLTGMPPFRTGKPAEDKYLKVVARHLRNPAPDAAQTNPSVDRGLANLAKQMMAKKPGDRPSYGELIEQLTGLLARIDPGSVPQLIATSRERSRPFSIPQGPGAALEGGATLSDGELAAVPRSGLPAWLVVFTLLCTAFFIAGLVVYLQRGGSDASAITPTPGSGSTGSSAIVTPDAAVVAKVPDGMILVKLADGSKLYVDAQPVSADRFRKVFADHKQAGKPDDAVTMVKYDEAQAFARTSNGRLLRAAEWTAASTTPGFISIDGMWEWVESPKEARTVVQHGKSQNRPDKEQKDVTFRMAVDVR